MAKVFTGTGRRKSSVAQVKMTAGSGKITVNGRDVNEFMPYETYVMDLKQPLVATNNENTFDIEVKVNGGGASGQTGAIRLGITRCLLAYDEANEDLNKEQSCVRWQRGSIPYFKSENPRSVKIWRHRYPTLLKHAS